MYQISKSINKLKPCLQPNVPLISCIEKENKRGEVNCLFD